MSFSPKAPASMVGTFAMVLVFTMFKEAFEDLQRHRQDRDLNNKESLVFDSQTLKFVKKKWADIKSGELVKILKDEEFPADLVLLKSDKESGIAFVDTMNLDGETNLKEKVASKEMMKLEVAHVLQMSGALVCDSPNEYLDRWDGNITTVIQGKKFVFNTSLKTLLLRGCTLRNTEFCMGIAIYTGPESKIMMNAKKPPTKVSNVQRKMNQMLYSVFAFQLILILIYAILSVFWIKNKAPTHYYLNLQKDPGFGDFCIQYLTYWVAYSHLIPISLYVVLEIIKLGQAKLIGKDLDIYDKETGFSICRNSDLIEEMGQVEFIFSDKTGTLTCNVMEFKQCSINGKIYESLDDVNALFKRNNSVNKDVQDIKACHEFFRFMAVCHTVVIDKDKQTGKPKMQASSPDELALVQGSLDVGFKFVERTPLNLKIEIEYLKNKQEKYSVQAEFPFDSTRKRMTLLVKEEHTGKYLLMTKGADSIMLPRTTLGGKQKKQIEDHLYQFACSGLRTLVMAQKEMTQQQYNVFNKRYQQLMVSNDSKKDDMLNQLYDEMEKDLQYVGSSAIEDLLQEEVPETIELLMTAGIRVWVLTGDKQETAIEIGKSCNLINEKTMDLVILSSQSREEFDKKLADAETKKYEHEKKSIVIDGSTLTMVLENNTISQRFFQFGCTANSVICCRVSPKQKSDIVALAKRNGTWITLSVGDGANDVPMIMEAHIGVGIRGKEGTQAVRSADYAIGKFKFLQKLILAHGRWGYRRVGLFICYYFYKNVILVFCELYFAFFNGYSGQIYFADWLPMLYNTLWTSWPCIFTYIFDRDVNSKMSVKSPELYSAGPKHVYFNFKVFWKWMVMALFHGWVCYFFPQLGYKGVLNKSGFQDHHWFVSSISFTLCLHIVTYKLFLESFFWTNIQIIFGIASIILYYIVVLILNTDVFSDIFQPQIDGIFNMILVDAKFWLMIICVPFLALLPDITLTFVFRVFYKSPADVAMLVQKNGGVRPPSKYQDKTKTEPIDMNRTESFNNDLEKTPLKSQNLNESQSKLLQNKVSINKSDSPHFLNLQTENNIISPTKKMNKSPHEIEQDKEFFKNQLQKMRDIKNSQSPLNKQQQQYNQGPFYNDRTSANSPSYQNVQPRDQTKKRKHKTQRIQGGHPTNIQQSHMQNDMASDLYQVYDMKNNVNPIRSQNMYGISELGNGNLNYAGNSNRLIGESRPNFKKQTGDYDIDYIAKQLNIR